MALTLYDIIVGTVVTDKSTKLVDKYKKITLQVHPDANKTQVAAVLEKLFNVRVKDVNIKVRKGKVRHFKRIVSRGRLTKQAIVTLKDQESFDILTQTGANSKVPGTGSFSISETSE